MANKSTQKGNSTREHVIGIAMNLFVLNGFHGTSLRNLAQESGLALGGIYNHFANKDEIFEEVLFSYHPWLMIPDVVSTSKGSNLEEFTHDAAHRLRVIWNNSPNLMKLHHIETIEFQGRHLSKLFERVFQDLTIAVDIIKKKNPQLSDIQTANFSRAMLGLFFAYLATHRLPDELKESNFENTTFDYLTDAYLFGVLTGKNEDSNDDK